MAIAMSGHEFSEDNGRMWKESLRPLSPGRVSEKDDTIKGKPRSNSVSSSRRTRSRSVSPSRLHATTVSSRAKERDAIRFEYKKRSRPTAPVARTRSKSASPSREIPRKKSFRPSSVPRDDLGDKGDGSDSGRTPMTWAAPSALSWSGTPDRELSSASHFRSEDAYMDTSKNIQASQTHTSNSRNFTNKVVKKMSHNENKIEYPKQATKQDKAIIKRTKPVCETQTSDTYFFTQEQAKTKKVQKEKKLEDWTIYPDNKEAGPEIKKEIPIPVQNYKSSRPAASLPARRESIRPSFDKKKRRKSLSTYSKT